MQAFGSCRAASFPVVLCSQMQSSWMWHMCPAPLSMESAPWRCRAENCSFASSKSINHVSVWSTLYWDVSSLHRLEKKELGVSLFPQVTPLRNAVVKSKWLQVEHTALGNDSCSLSAIFYLQLVSCTKTEQAHPLAFSLNCLWMPAEGFRACRAVTRSSKLYTCGYLKWAFLSWRMFIHSFFTHWFSSLEAFFFWQITKAAKLGIGRLVCEASIAAWGPFDPFYPLSCREEVTIFHCKNLLCFSKTKLPFRNSLPEHISGEVFLGILSVPCGASKFPSLGQTVPKLKPIAMIKDSPGWGLVSCKALTGNVDV